MHITTLPFVNPRRLFGPLAPALVLALAVVGPARAATAKKQTIIFFGDSITAGYGLDDPDEAYPGVIESRIREAGLPFRVVNAGLSGETSAGGLRRVDWILKQPCDVFVLALGGNDGLRGLDPTDMKHNLIGILAKVHAKYPRATLVVAGMKIFPSMGEDYREGFETVFPEVAESPAPNSSRFCWRESAGFRDSTRPTAFTRPSGAIGSSRTMSGRSSSRSCASAPRKRWILCRIDFSESGLRPCDCEDCFCANPRQRNHHDPHNAPNRSAEFVELWGGFVHGGLTVGIAPSRRIRAGQPPKTLALGPASIKAA